MNIISLRPVFFRMFAFSLILSSVFTPIQGQDTVDASTLDGKVMFGYQGWFSCAGDGADYEWNHWFRGGEASASRIEIDIWPDLSEFEDDHLYSTPLKMPDGSPARLYSAWDEKSVDIHFKWMKDYNLDGVFLQRFISHMIRGGTRERFRNKVLANVKQSAENHGRAWAVMYDISNSDARDYVEAIKEDWAYLVDEVGVTESPGYLHHRGKPVMAIWGLGFTDRSGSPGDARELIQHFTIETRSEHQVTLIGGIPSRWRELGSDSKNDAAWAEVYRSFDILLPWTIGRFRTESENDKWTLDYTGPDLQELSSLEAEYFPVTYPGFSRRNLTQKDEPLNKYPRDGGKFFWRQVYNNVKSGASMIYIAMFDEVDEGTAMFKMAPTREHQPEGVDLMALDADGYNLPSDFYLRLSDMAGRMLRGEIVLDSALPLSLTEPWESVATVPVKQPLNSRQNSVGNKSYFINGRPAGIRKVPLINVRQ